MSILERIRPPTDADAGLRSVAAAIGIGAALLATILLWGPMQPDIGISSRLVPVFFLGVLIPIFLLPARRVWLAIGALVCTWFLAIGSIELIPEVIDPSPPVADAVGDAIILGRPYTSLPYAEALGFGLVAIVAVAATLFARHGAAPRQVARDEPHGEGPSDRGGALVVAVATAVIAFTLIPDVEESAGVPYAMRDFLSVDSVPQPSFDAGNFLAWSDFIARGLVPMKDFFYPYGGRWLYELVPAGPLIRWGVTVALLAIAAWALWRLSSRRTWPVVLCLAVMPLFITWSGSFMLRHLPVFLLALVYAAIGPLRNRRLGGDDLIFGGAWFLAVFLGAEQLLYGLGAMATILLGSFVAGEIRWSPGNILRRFAVDLLPAAVAVAVVVLIWTATGALEGNLRFFADLRAVSAYAATDPDLNSLNGLSLEPTSISLYIALPTLLLVAGLALAAWGGPRQRSASMLLLAAAGFTIVRSFEHLIRGPSMDYLLLIPLLALLWVAILYWSRRPVMMAAASALVIAMLVSVQQADHVLTRYLERAAESPVRAFQSAKFPTEVSELRSDAEELYRVSRYEAWPDHAALREYRAVVGEGPVPSFTVLGYLQMLYVWLDQDPPYHIENYSAAPITEQEAMLEALEREQPRYLIWRREGVESYFYTFRTPLHFAYAVRHYVPVRLGDDFDILRRRNPREPIDTDYWTSRFGPTVDIGFIPSYSKLDEASRCESGDNCVPVAAMEGESPGDGEMLTLRVTGRGREFTLLMRTRAGVDTYPVRLDHLWFSPLLGRHPRVESATPGWTTRLQRLDAGDALY